LGDEKKEKRGLDFKRDLEILGDLPSEKMFPESFSRKFPYYNKVKVLRIGVESYRDDPFSRDVVKR
jgi:hypothetical protein